MKMKKTIGVGMLLVALSQAAQEVNAPRIPDAATALKIAEPLLVKTYGRKQIDSEKPLSAKLVGGVWFIFGTLWCSDGKGGRTSDPGSCDGGVGEIKLRQRDGKVLSIFHGK
jgi:hypothetical protein